MTAFPAVVVKSAMNTLKMASVWLLCGVKFMILAPEFYEIKWYDGGYNGRKRYCYKN